MQGVEYTLLSFPVTRPISSAGLSDRTVPDTIDIEQDGVTYTLALQKVAYTENRKVETVTHTIDLGYAPQQPTAPANTTVTHEKYGETALLLDGVIQSEGFGWYDMDIAAIFYGSENSSGFVLGDRIMPNEPGGPPWRGYEDDMLRYLGLNPDSFRITGAAWLDDGFSDGRRDAVVYGQMYTARWAATYSAEASEVESYDANAVYANGETEYRFMATATYAELLEEPSGSSVPVVAIILGCVLAAILVVIILLILAKRRDTRQSREN